MPFLLPNEAGLELEDIDNVDNDVYKPTGLNQVFYDEKKKDRKRKHVSVSKLEHILEDLKADADISDSEEDLPKEEKMDELSNIIAIKKIREREEYEESTFTRTILTKKQKRFEKKLAMGQYIDPDVEGEEIMRLLNGEEDKNEQGKKQKKFKKKPKQKGFQKKCKGRRK